MPGLYTHCINTPHYTGYHTYTRAGHREKKTFVFITYDISTDINRMKIYIIFLGRRMKTWSYVVV